MTSEPPFIESVFVATDFSPESEIAFAHALAIALLREADFAVLHATHDEPSDADWRKFPAVRSTLERWGVLEPGSPRSAVFDGLSVRAQKINAQSRSVVSAMLDYVTAHQPDLLVLGTEGREGLPALLRPSAAEQVARHSNTMTLFVPRGARPLVSLSDGSFRLQRVLVPVAEEPSAQSAVIYAQRLADLMADDDPVEIVLLHVGSGRPTLAQQEGSAWTIRAEVREGDVVEQILDVAHELEADLIAMSTDGRDGILGALGQGSHTERVVRGAECPVLAVPEARA